MAVEVKPVQDLLSTITDAFVAAKDAFPEDTDSFIPPTDGISLLDVKNDLLLSYLQHLVFLILLRLKHAGDSTSSQADLGKQVVNKLVELRAYLDRGVRPLEGRLRYQIDKVLRAAEDAERTAVQKSQANGTGKKEKKAKRALRDDNSDILNSGSDSAGSSDVSEDDQDNGVDDEEMAVARPNTAAISARFREKAIAQSTSNTRSGAGRQGVYKPPRLNPTTMPDSRSRTDPDETRIARRRKNALLDEFINEEHSNTPTVQPSIGSNNTILDRGRSHTSLHTRDRDKEREKLAYEESNFTRLPGASKAEKKKDKARQMRESRDMFGGEDWTGLGGMGDRIGRTVAGGKDRGSMLERRDKRKRDTQDMPRGDGVGIGESFEKRRKVLQGRDQKKRGGRR